MLIFTPYFNFIYLFLYIVISTHLSYELKREYPLDNANKNIIKTTPDNYYANKFSIVGYVQPGLGFISVPSLPYPIGSFIVTCLPITFVSFMVGIYMCMYIVV